MTPTAPGSARARRGVRAAVLGGLALALVIAGLLSSLASPEPDGLESAIARTQCDDAPDRDACLEALAGEPALSVAPGALDGYRVTWLSGLVGVAATFALGAGLLALTRWRRDAHGARGRAGPSAPPGR